jgi:hypothetical protein
VTKPGRLRLSDDLAGLMRGFFKWAAADELVPMASHVGYGARFSILLLPIRVEEIGPIAGKVGNSRKCVLPSGLGEGLRSVALE